MRHLLWREGVADVDDPHPRILIGRKDQLGALERAGAIFMQIMRAEFRALLAVILLSRGRKGADLHRVRRLAHIEYPAALDPIGAIVEIALIGEHREVTVGERQRRMGAAAE